MKKSPNPKDNRRLRPKVNSQIFFFRFLLLLLSLGSGQLCLSQKISKATQQKTFAGMGGVFMNYLVEFKNPKGIIMEIDSVISIADSSSIKFGFTRFDPSPAGQEPKSNRASYNNQISFGYALSKPEKCKTCPDAIPNQQNLTKGVIIYGKRGEKGEKKFVLKVKKFKLLPDLRTP